MTALLATQPRLETETVPLPDGTQVRVELVWLTPQLAAQLLTDCHFAHQRTLSVPHAEFLAYEMLAGRFAVEGMYLVHCGEKVYLTDGQHRCEAVIRSGVTLLAPLVHIYVQDEEAVARDYIRRDIGRVRSVKDTYAAADLAAKTELSRTQLNTLGSAGALFTCGFSHYSSSPQLPAQRSREVRWRLVLDWAPAAREFFSATAGIGSARRKQLSRAAVVAVALVTCRYQPEKAREFWGRVAHGEHLEKGDPEHTLIAFLDEYSASSRRKHEYARGVANAWNARFRGERLALIKVPQSLADRPIEIAGTPYDGKDVRIMEYEDAAE